MDDLLKLVGTVLGVAAAGVGILLTVDQLTLGSRHRKTETWARDAAKDETDPHRVDYLKKLQVVAVAGVIGSIEVPFRYFAEGLLTPLFMGYAAVGILTTETGITPSTLWTAVPFVFVSTGLTYRRGVRVYLERRRVVNAYTSGKGALTGAQLGMLDQMEGGTLREFSAALGLATATSVSAVGVALMMEDHEGLGLWLTVTGVGLLVVAGNVVRVWGLPMYPVSVSGTPAGTAPAAGGGTVAASPNEGGSCSTPAAEDATPTSTGANPAPVPASRRARLLRRP